MLLLALNILVFVFIPYGKCLQGSSTIFLGTGYDLRIGNPMGQSIYEGGIDLGLKPFKHILTINTSDCSQQCTLVNLEGTVRSSTLIDDIDKYDCELHRYWKLNEYNAHTCEQRLRFAGRGSHATKEVLDILQQRQDVIIAEETWKIQADISYDYQNYIDFNPQFLTQLCSMPQEFSNNTQDIFFTFLRTWGTHVIVNVRVGERKVVHKLFEKNIYMSHILDNYKDLASVNLQDGSKFVSIASKATSSFSSDIVRTLSESNGQYATYTSNVGSSGSAMPLSIRLINLSYFISHVIIDLSSGYCSHLTNETLPNLRQATQDAIYHYLKSTDIEINSAEIIRKVPLQWPKGTYSLPMTKSINYCPYMWEAGYRHHDFHDESPSKTSWSPELPLYINSELKDDPNIGFCSKTVDKYPITDGTSSGDSFAWNSGSFCVFKKGNCPDKFHVASVSMEGENGHTTDGTLPDGEYTYNNTRYDFCCRNDNSPYKPIYLPTDSPLFLIPVSQTCQTIQGMDAKIYYILFGTGTRGKSMIEGSVRPAAMTDNNYNFKLFFCHYIRQISKKV